MTFEELRDIMVDTLACEADEIKPESRLVEDLDADSLAIVEMVMALEEATGLTIEDEEARKLRSVNDILGYINSHKA